MADPLDLDGVSQAESIRTGDLTPAELVDAACRRAEAHNPGLNAIIHPDYDRACETAATAADGPLRGVPMVVKDLVCRQAGLPFHEGSRFLKDEIGWIGPDDQELAVRFRAAGLVPIGRTNTPEFGLRTSCEPDAYGPTRNPHSPQHSAGGSSGGSAAAVAAGIVAIGHGSDAGGSIRIPAAFCGLVGLKPSRHRLTQAPDFGDSFLGVSGEGVITRSVRDTATVLDAVSEPAIGEWAPSWPLAGRLADHVGRDPGRLRVGVWASPSIVDVDPAVAATVRAAAGALGALGHEVDDDHPSALEEDIRPCLTPHYAAGAAWLCDHHWPRTVGSERPIPDELLEPGTRRLRDVGRAATAAQLLEARELAQAWTRRLAAWWVGHDVLALPTVAVPPPLLGETDDRVVMALTAPFNLSGHPAVSLPLAGADGAADGLPVGVQLVAAHGREDILVEVAAQLENGDLWRVAPAY